MSKIENEISLQNASVMEFICCYIQYMAGEFSIITSILNANEWEKRRNFLREMKNYLLSANTDQVSNNVYILIYYCHIYVRKMCFRCSVIVHDTRDVAFD